MWSYEQKKIKKCTEYMKFYMCISDTIYFHPDFTYDIDSNIQTQIINNKCKNIKFLNKVYEINSKSSLKLC